MALGTKATCHHQKQGCIMQAAEGSHGLFHLAVSVTRPTDVDSTRIAGTKAAPGLSWHKGRITADMINQVKAFWDRKQENVLNSSWYFAAAVLSVSCLYPHA